MPIITNADTFSYRLQIYPRPAQRKAEEHIFRFIAFLKPKNALTLHFVFR